ncbi:hypothetical protein XELAEV_18039671mg [Xenopus laevis]|uniref:Uncharacterized protein n=1 Tax=Xenopus laevis TaxID=8355 RepID=A0A974H838_XENLA|nr:hypothetical protein XELAEV_18039671mg [Xenopus laevis]
MFSSYIRSTDNIYIYIYNISNIKRCFRLQLPYSHFYIKTVRMYICTVYRDAEQSFKFAFARSRTCRFCMHTKLNSY